MLDKFPDMFLFQTEIPRDFHILSHECVEIPLIVLGLFFVALLFYVASKTTVAVHIHLRIFILNLLVASAVASIFRIVSLTLVISVNQEYVHTFRRPFMALRYIAQYTGSFNLFFILCERLYATWNAHCYEQIKAVKWVFALIVFEWLLVSIYIVLSFIVKIDGIVSVFVEIVVNICILMLFTLVVGIQAYFYKKAKSKVVFRNRHSLTERYQINENFVSTKAFYPTLVFLCTITFTGTTLYAASYAIKDNDTLFVICDLLLALKLFALPILIFLSNKSLRSTLAKLVFCPRSTTICVGQACESKRISTISAADQGAVYFAELQKKWNQN